MKFVGRKNGKSTLRRAPQGARGLNYSEVSEALEEWRVAPRKGRVG